MSYGNEQILEFLPWARGFARTCAAKLPSHLDRDDLQSAGVVGYLKAASRYDSDKGASFRSFCALRIRGAVLDELRRWDWAPRSVHKDNKRVTSVTSNLMEQLEREPTDTELAEALGMDVMDLSAFRANSHPRQVISMNQLSENSHGDETVSLAERLADSNTPAPDAAVLFAEDRRALRKCLKSLPKTMVTVIVLHYLQHVSLRDVAKMLTVTPSRVSQLHHEALGRLRQAWSKHQAMN